MRTTLGVNVDHVATLREARKINEPDPAKAALICEEAGAHCVTIHLREDRRHIKDQDVKDIKNLLQIKLNLEMANVKEIVNFALKIKPHQVTLVPEKRNEITTEGGLDVCSEIKKITKTVEEFKKKKIKVSLFIAPDKKQIEASKKTGAEYIEIHTGFYANAKSAASIKKELKRIKDAAAYASALGLGVNAGHGLNYTNVAPIARIEQIEELNIGHSIISRAIFVGLRSAVLEMLWQIES